MEINLDVILKFFSTLELRVLLFNILATIATTQIGKIIVRRYTKITNGYLPLLIAAAAAIGFNTYDKVHIVNGLVDGLVTWLISIAATWALFFWLKAKYPEIHRIINLKPEEPPL